jgi:NADH-quinone oxidoreductase subunit L
VVLYGVGLFTAFMTAFYMNRLMWKTFYVDPQFVDGELVAHSHDDADAEAAVAGHDEGAHGASPADAGHDAAHGHGGGHVHPSPPSMMWPLYVLAVLSFGFGIWAALTHSFEHFLEPSVAPLSLGPLRAQEELFSPIVGYVVSALVAIAGLVTAYLLYSAHKANGLLRPEEQKARDPLYRFLAAKWGFDALYSAVFIRGGGRLADALWKGVDVQIIDGTVNGLARIVGAISQKGRGVQTGYVRNYAFAMLLGAVCLVAGLLLTWIKVSQ